jgi:hypothetical protein
MIWVFFLALTLMARAQELNSYTIRDGRMYITLNVHIDRAKLDSFIVQYDLTDLDLPHILKDGKFDKLRKKGWRVDESTSRVLSISKQLLGTSDLGNPGKRMVITEMGSQDGHPTLAERFPYHNDDLIFGCNQFINKFPFSVVDSFVTFFMRGRTNARQTLLAGSFTNWQFGALAMTRTDSGWIVRVKLAPGKYWYKFIVDGGWTTDRDNQLSENDGEGNMNSVYYKPNVTFTLNRFLHAQHVYLTGSFNSWDPGGFPMALTQTGWMIQVYLSEGTHRYKFIVDGTPYTDPDNPHKLPDGQDGFNSVLALGKPYLFRLSGFSLAKSVILSGTFNNWSNFELVMIKTKSGWEFPLVLGPGNYAYKFLVDGKAIQDPGNPYFIGTDPVASSFLIIEPNYTFRLHKYAKALKVYLAGDFNDWTQGSLLMKRVGDDWIFPIHLSVGKHLYKFIVDGEWIKDPGNPLWEENEVGTGNSIIWISP